MIRKQYVLYVLGGRQVSSYSFGKLVQRRYIDLIPSEIASQDLNAFLVMLRDAQNEMDTAGFSQSRVGHVDNNGVGQYYDAREFLKSEGRMDGYSEPEPLPVAAN
ncbi:MAG: hypothetical protein OXI77_08740 [Chloroflexota bacterium]|nr:hypothetical protein [Chloroflexota bacterium]MDE2909700.1 hypothetical protein [Chloroflexota bacterium]